MITTLCTYPDGRQVFEPFVSPFKAGDLVVIPKNTFVNRYDPNQKSSLSGRRFTVKVRSITKSYLTDETMSSGLHMVPPEIVWAGSGGYWARVRLTEEVLEANGFNHHNLEPDMDALYLARHILRYNLGRN